ncbi:lipocalin family protein [uncultured Bacteroides sp.]|nr:lipocalin family protein [uncultured Bacteroides sp.]
MILSDKSISNHETISFSDTLTIEKLTKDELMLKKGNLTISYQKQ